MFWPHLHHQSGLGMQRREPDKRLQWPGCPRKDQCHVPQPCWRTWPDFWQEEGGPEETIMAIKTSRMLSHITWKCKASTCTYKGPCVLMHGGSSTYRFTKSILDKLGRGEIGESLSKIDGFVIGSQLWEFHPGERNPIRCFSFSV